MKFDVEKYRLEGALAYAAGKPYTDCPYLPFPSCEEGMAWKNGWLAAKEKEKGVKKDDRKCD